MSQVVEIEGRPRQGVLEIGLVLVVNDRRFAVVKPFGASTNERNLPDPVLFHR